VEPVLRRNRERQARARARARLHQTRAVLDDRVPPPAAAAAHVVLDHRVRPAGVVGPEAAGHRLERLFHRWHRVLPFGLASGGLRRASGPPTHPPKKENTTPPPPPLRRP